MIHGKILGVYGAIGGLASLFAVEMGADVLNLPNWFKDNVAAAAAIGSTILFLKYIVSRDKSQAEREATRDKLFADTLTGLADDFREDREKDRQERKEGWQYLREATHAMRNEAAKSTGK